MIIVIGAKCAGKTTLADRVAQRENVRVFEASSVFRGIASDHSSAETQIRISSLSQKLGVNVGALELGSRLTSCSDQTCVITGLRTAEELLHLRRPPGSTVTVLVEADARIRYERHVNRGRATRTLSRSRQRNGRPETNEC